MANTITLSDAQFKAEVLDSTQPVLVDFWATWCAPCIAMEPALEELATTHLGKLKVVKVNIEQNQVTAQAYNVRSLPNLLVFKGGEGRLADRRRRLEAEARRGRAEVPLSFTSPR